MTTDIEITVRTIPDYKNGTFVDKPVIEMDLFPSDADSFNHFLSSSEAREVAAKLMTAADECEALSNSKS